jgi:hypothetical protein
MVHNCGIERHPDHLVAKDDLDVDLIPDLGWEVEETEAGVLSLGLGVLNGDWFLRCVSEIVKTAT